MCPSRPDDPAAFCLGRETTEPTEATRAELGLDDALLDACERAIDTSIARFGSTLRVAVSWSISRDPGTRATCHVVNADPPVVAITIAAGALMRLWSATLGVLAASDASEWCDYDRELREQTALNPIFAFEHLEPDGFRDTDAAVVASTFDDLGELNACVRRLVERSDLVSAARGMRAVWREVAATAVVHGVLFMVLHELAHAMRDHFPLRANMAADTGLRHLISAGFELDADYAAALMLVGHVSEQHRDEPTGVTDDRWASIALGLRLLMYMIELERLRYVDAASRAREERTPVRSTPHLMDVGRLRIVFEGMVGAVAEVSGAVSAERFRAAADEASGVFTHGLYFLFAGALTAASACAAIADRELVRAGAALRRYQAGGLAFRADIERSAYDTLVVFAFYRRFAIDGRWDGAIAELDDVEESLGRLIAGHNELTPMTGMQTMDPAEARRIRMQWQEAVELDGL